MILACRRVLVAASTAAALSQAACGAAAALERDACISLMYQQRVMLDRGMEKTLAKGPEWAKLNLSPDALDEIARFLSIEDKVRFQCDGVSPKDVPKPAPDMLLPERKPPHPDPQSRAAAD